MTSSVLRVSFQWHFSPKHWDKVRRRPGDLLGKWISAVSPGADEDLGDALRWESRGHGVVTGFIRVFDVNVASTVLARSGKMAQDLVLFLDPAGRPPTSFYASKLLWLPWDGSEDWGSYLARARQESSFGVVRGDRQLGVRIAEKDVKCAPAKSTWSLKWIPFNYRRDTFKAFLEAPGFQDVELTDKRSSKAGARWLFRAKRSDDLQVVLGDVEDDQGVFQVEAILEAKSRTHTAPGTPLKPERRIHYGAAPSHENQAVHGIGAIAAMSDQEPGDLVLQEALREPSGGDESQATESAASRKRPGTFEAQAAPPEPKQPKTLSAPAAWKISGSLSSNTGAGWRLLVLSVVPALNYFGDTGSDSGQCSHRQLRALTIAAINKNRAQFEAVWVAQGRPDDCGVLQDEEATFKKYLDCQKVPGCWAGSS